VLPAEGLAGSQWAAVPDVAQVPVLVVAAQQHPGRAGQRAGDGADHGLCAGAYPLVECGVRVGGRGLVTYLIREDDRELLITQVLWFG